MRKFEKRQSICSQITHKCEGRDGRLDVGVNKGCTLDWGACLKV